MRHFSLIFTLIMLLPGVGSYAASTPPFADRDLDGVFDNRDRCPHTPFWAQVNRNGCMIRKIHLPKQKTRQVRKHLTQDR